MGQLKSDEKLYKINIQYHYYFHLLAKHFFVDIVYFDK